MNIQTTNIYLSSVSHSDVMLPLLPHNPCMRSWISSKAPHLLSSSSDTHGHAAWWCHDTARSVGFQLNACSCLVEGLLASMDVFCWAPSTRGVMGWKIRRHIFRLMDANCSYGLVRLRADPRKLSPIGSVKAMRKTLIPLSMSLYSFSHVALTFKSGAAVDVSLLPNSMLHQVELFLLDSRFPFFWSCEVLESV